MTTFADHELDRTVDLSHTSSLPELPALLCGLLTGAERKRLLEIAQNVLLVAPEPAIMVTGLEHRSFPEILATGMPGVEHYRHASPRTELSGTVHQHLLVHVESSSAALITIAWSAREPDVRTSVASIGPKALFEELVVRCTEWTNNGRAIPQHWA